MAVDVARRRPPSRRPAVLVVGLCLAVAVATLAAPIDLAYDGWSWLVWGREVRRLALDTTTRPSWKPLPVIPATVLSLAGGVTPQLWLVLARTVGLVALAVVYRLAARWGGWVAGVTAVVALFLAPDEESRFTRLVLEGHVEPVTVTLALLAVDRHVVGRRTQALWLGTAVALSRPEAWPFLGLYAAWLWWRHEVPAWVAALALAVVPVCWFGGDRWGSGGWGHGAQVAQQAGGSDWDRLVQALDRAGEMVPWPVFVAAAIGLAEAARRRRRGPIVLAAVAAGWTALVVAMCVALRYASLGRFYLVAAALVAVVAGLGVSAVVDGVRHGWRPAQVAAVVLALCVPFIWPRVHAIDVFLDEGPERSRFERALDPAIDAAVEAAGGRAALLACGPFAIEDSGLADVSRPALAWKLDLPLSQVHSRPTRAPEGVYFAQSGSPMDRTLAGTDPATVRLIARTDTWSVWAIGCDPGAGA